MAIASGVPKITSDSTPTTTSTFCGKYLLQKLQTTHQPSICLAYVFVLNPGCGKSGTLIVASICSESRDEYLRMKFFSGWNIMSWEYWRNC